MNGRTADVLGARLAIITLEGLSEHVRSLIAAGESGYICFATAHMIVIATRDENVRCAYRNAAIISPDGVPLAWLLRLLGARDSRCVSGPRSLPRLLQMASDNRIAVGFYGGRPETLAIMNQRINREYPQLRVTYTYSPPFRPLAAKEQEAAIGDINRSGVQMLFVGLGSPRQECWMHRFSPTLNCVCLGVGAAFEFFSGEKHLPPLWVHSLGLNWLARLLQEPRRLFRRNLYSPIFVFMALRWALMDERQRTVWKSRIDRRLAGAHRPTFATATPIHRAQNRTGDPAARNWTGETVGDSTQAHRRRSL